MKKVIMTLILTTLLPITGISHYNLCHAEDIFPSTPLVPDTAPIYSSYYDDAGEMLYIYGCLSGNNAEMKVQHNETIVLYDIVSMMKCIRGYDTLLILGVSGCVFVPILKIFTHSKIVVNIDGLEYRRQKWGKMAKWFLRQSEKMAVRYADTIIADNQGIKEYVKNTYNKDAVMIAYGGDHALMDVMEEKEKEILDFFGLEKGRYALSICRIEPENNVDIVLDVFAKTNKPIAVVGNFQNNEYSRGLREKYSRPDSGLTLLDLEDSVQLSAKPEHFEDLIRIVKKPRTYELTETMLETLAIIAYRQPVTKLEMEQIRGVKCDYSVQSLMNKGLIMEVGRRDSVGHPILYGTTDTFLSYFGLRTLSELPAPPDTKQDEAEEELEI